MKNISKRIDRGLLVIWTLDAIGVGTFVYFSINEYLKHRRFGWDFGIDFWALVLFSGFAALLLTISVLAVKRSEILARGIAKALLAIFLFPATVFLLGLVFAIGNIGGR